MVLFMSRVGLAYKKTVELRRGTTLDVDDNTILTITDSASTEDFTLSKDDFIVIFNKLNVKTVSADYTILLSDQIVIVEAAAPVAITLLDPSISEEIVLIIINKYDSVSNVTLDKDVNGATLILGPSNTSAIVSDGTEYLVAT